MLSSVFVAAFPFKSIIIGDLPGYTVLSTSESEQRPREKQELSALSRVNLLVGENNSGKSRFLRYIAKTELEVRPEDAYVNGLNELIIRAKTSMLDGILQNGSIDANGYFHRTKELAPITIVSEKDKYADHFRGYVRHLQQASGTAANVRSWNSIVAQKVKHLGDDLLEDLLKLDLPEKLEVKRLYIPTLRGLRDVGSGEDVYETRILTDCFSTGSGRNVPVFTGLRLYKEYKRLLLGSYEQREWVREFEAFLSKEFFSGRQITIIPSEEGKSLEIKVGRERQRKIAQLGDGLHSIIILTFPLFQFRDECIAILYEEPELTLHPALQRQFLNSLTSGRFPNQQYFLTTHSNHLLDLTADTENVSVFTFRRHFPSDRSQQREDDAEFLIENVSNDNVHTLELLGVRNSSVFLSNCTIWVEGITDRRYLSHYLRLYAESQNFRVFKEDLHFSFVEYSGSNITHWSFLDDTPDPIQVDRLCAKLLLISDNDDAKKESKKSERFEQLKNRLGDRFIQLPVREIENLLSAGVLKKIVSDYEGENPELNEFQENDYQSAYLGRFIEDKVLKAKNRKGSYADKSGTVSDKVNFCSKAVRATKTFDDLSDTAKKITIRVYNFIASTNG